MWTPSPPRALSTAASVAVSVLPSPVFISAIEPSWSAIPPMSCTSKWRWPSPRLAASRVRANDSARRSSRDSPFRARSRSASARSRSSSSVSSSSSGSKSLMRATRFSKALNFFPSPIRSARSMIDMRARLAPRSGGRRARLDLTPAAAPALVAVALDLASELVGDEVYRPAEVLGGVPRPQRDALEGERRGRDLRRADRRVALLGELELEARERRHLPRDLLEPPLGVLAQTIVDCDVAPPHLDAHRLPPLVVLGHRHGTSRRSPGGTLPPRRPPRVRVISRACARRRRPRPARCLLRGVLARALKFRGAVALADVMAAQIASGAPPDLLEAGALVPVPLPPARRRRRGFNQAESLARALARRTGASVVDCLERGGGRGTQMGRDRDERLRALAGTIAVRRRRSPPRTAVLVDDVLTTGATLLACARARGRRRGRRAAPMPRATSRRGRSARLRATPGRHGTRGTAARRPRRSLRRRSTRAAPPARAP